MAEKRQYLVTWEMDVIATSPRQAAKFALQIQRNSKSDAQFFGVREFDADPGSEVTVDLLDGTDNHA